jgi:PPOX class probable F420-dependent enzyme
VRKGLSIEELGDLLVLPLNATLATYRRDGSVLLSPVWHEWSDGGFSIFTSATDVKLRHIERQGRAAAVVADHTKPYRGIEVSGEPTIIRDPGAANTTVLRICSRYLGEDRAKLYVASVWTVPSVVIRLTPGQLRTWDFADDEELLDLSPR